MALTERQEFGSITIRANGVLEVRSDRVILDDGVELVRSLNRTLYTPNMDPATLPNKVRQVAQLVWTPAIVSAWLAANS